ncbi:hypothetical protein V2J09_006369 [Rumex salicifolius]
MEQVTTRQRALEEKMIELLKAVSGKEKGPNNEVGEGSSGGSVPRSTPHIIPRYSKMEFPKYDGAEDPLGWLKRCEKFFANQRTAEGDKVHLAAFHLLDEAQLWFDQVEKEEANLNWERFRECCHVRFGPPMSNNPLGELVNLKQSGSVAEYQENFQILLARTSDLTPRQQQPGNLGIAMNMTRSLSISKFYHKGACDKTPRMNIANPSQDKSATDYTNSQGTALPPEKSEGSSLSSMGSSSLFIKKLTRDEMAERRAKGLCYNCDDPYVRGHKCWKLFWIEVQQGFELEDKLGAPGGDVMIRDPRSRPSFQELLKKLKDLARQYSVKHQASRSTPVDISLQEE